MYSDSQNENTRCSSDTEPGMIKPVRTPRDVKTFSSVDRAARCCRRVSRAGHRTGQHESEAGLNDKHYARRRANKLNLVWFAKDLHVCSELLTPLVAELLIPQQALVKKGCIECADRRPGALFFHAKSPSRKGLCRTYSKNSRCAAPRNAIRALALDRKL